MKRRVAIVGATGSVGRQALQVAELSETLEVVAAGVHSKWEELVQLVGGDQPLLVVDDAAREAAMRAVPERTWVPTVEDLFDSQQLDVVLNAAVGSSGLLTTVHTLERGIDLALANKESLVCGGPLVTALARARGARILPVDSEHSALMQCMQAGERGDIDSLVLTASGGPFAGSTGEDLADVTVEQALAHPTWTMGSKISIDSATLMNKGLELIEAQVLFDLPTSAIEVVVHRDSIVHALVRLVDGAVVAHLGWPDMRVPISYALHYPSRIDVGVDRLDLTSMPALSFEQPDTTTFACLGLAIQAAEQGPGACCVLNAANEIAVGGFLAGRIGFLQIPELVERTLDRVPAAEPSSFDEVYALDAHARAAAEQMLLAARVTR